MVWSDEFDGNALDASKWSYQLGNGATVGNQGWGNNELEYYTDRPENVRVEGGNLIITARKEQVLGTAAGGNEGQAFGWSSGRIRTAGKFSRTYGKIEFRAKLPVGKGIWPAVWMLPEDKPGNPYASWAANGEIDIMEGWGSKPAKVAQTLHYGGMWPHNTYTSNEATLANGGTVNEWHTYTLEWRSNEIKWSIDGVVTSTQTKWWSSNVNPPDSDDDLNAWPAPFDKPFYLLINLAVGGNFDGNPNATTPDKAEMMID
ncbi:MAG: glycoside hydrolase family 16 protein, partial [Gammaproteobacteria bacterium]